MYCKNCDKEIPEKSKFCPECGMKVEAELVELVKENEQTRKGWDVMKKCGILGLLTCIFGIPIIGIGIILAGVVVGFIVMEKKG